MPKPFLVRPHCPPLSPPIQCLPGAYCKQLARETRANNMARNHAVCDKMLVWAIHPKFGPAHEENVLGVKKGGYCAPPPPPPETVYVKKSLVEGTN